VLGREEAPIDVGGEESSHGWLFSDVSHPERRELGEIRTLGVKHKRIMLILEPCKIMMLSNNLLRNNRIF
jgi:hypothetical protein